MVALGRTLLDVQKAGWRGRCPARGRSKERPQQAWCINSRVGEEVLRGERASIRRHQESTHDREQEAVPRCTGRQITHHGSYLTGAPLWGSGRRGWG